MNRWLKFFLGLILVITLIIIYARYVGTMGFITKEYTIYNKDIPSSYDGLKIVHFSDIHYNRAITSKKIDDIVSEINLINPDIVVFTGDLIDKDVSLTDSDFKFLANAFSKICVKYGKYALLGNHDYNEKDKVIQVFNDSDFKYLENSYDIIYNQYSDKIFIGGIGNVSYNLDNVDKTMEYFNSNNDITYRIMLTHEPDISDTIVDNYNVSLILGGHSHNGQVRIPGIGAVYTPNGAKKYYDEYYDLNGTPLYVSSGIGVSMLNYRLFNKPSINFYRVNKKS